MVKPLKNVMNTVSVIGELKSTYSTTEIDDKGNPKKTNKTGIAEVTIKVLDDQPKHRTTYGVSGDRLVVQLNFIKTWVKVGNEFVNMRLLPNDFAGTLKNETVSFTIIGTASYNLTPLTKVMGDKCLAIQDGKL